MPPVAALITLAVGLPVSYLVLLARQAARWLAVRRAFGRRLRQLRRARRWSTREVASRLCWSWLDLVLIEHGLTEPDLVRLAAVLDVDLRELMRGLRASRSPEE
ncbi:hypothetical protein GCM10022380_04030 [Amycolatopsis tucumanensis]|uniref:HTH cro/C1-type domain-containing protein n=1 Tax=Amycolatopsis tucumanensis TaxID=401106 RepID=A0ABP7HCC2_9PSEU